jgi:hypothetical protein
MVTSIGGKQMKKQIDYNDYAGAIDVMENYLDGALADFENGQVENTHLIEGCINAMKLIYSLANPWLLLGSVKDYEERFENAKTRQVSK